MKISTLKIRGWVSGAVQEAHFLFLLIGVPAVAAFIYITPPAWGLDEQMHIARMYHISTGNMYPELLDSEKKQYGGHLPSSLVRLLGHGHAESNSVNRKAHFFERQDIKNPARNQQLMNASVDSGSVEPYNFGPTGPYSPLVYAPGAVAMLFARILDSTIGNLVIAARLAQAMMYIVFVFVSLWILRSQRAKWLIFTIAVLPAAIFQAAIITADTFTIGATLLFSAVIIKLMLLDRVVSRRELFLALGSGALLMFTKPSYAILLGIGLFLPKGRFTNSRQALLFKGLLVAIGACLLGGVTWMGMPYADTITMYFEPLTASRISLAGQLGWMLANPFDFIVVILRTLVVFAEPWGESIIGVLGYNTIPVPYVMMQVAWIGIVLASLYGAARFSIASALGAVVVSVLSGLSILVLLYATFNPVGAHVINGVQGRYFIPCLPLFAFAVARLLPMKLTGGIDRFPHIVFGSIAVAAIYPTLYMYAGALS